MSDRITAQSGIVVVNIYGDIGYDITAAKFIEDFTARINGVDKIDLRINSYGGDAFDGVAIYNAIIGSGKAVTTHIDGIAASIASYIALAGDRIIMAPNAMVMIHEPWAAIAGDARDHARTAELLENMAASLATGYAKKLGVGAEVVRELMREETWWTAEEALKIGYADEILGTGMGVQDSMRQRLRLSAARKRLELMRKTEGNGR